MLFSRKPARYYTNEYYEDIDNRCWIIKITRRRDNTVTLVKIDSEDVELCRNHSWYPHHDPSKPSNLIYIKSTGGLRLHRVVMNPSKYMVVDHINHDTLDNRKANLRICTVSENNKNLSLSKRNNSGYIGVSYDKSRCKWVASKMIDGKLYSKRFSSRDEAVEYITTLLRKIND